MTVSNYAGADLEFFRGGADFQNFGELFRKSFPIIFCKIVTKKSRFFGAHPIKLVYIGFQKKFTFGRPKRCR